MKPTIAISVCVLAAGLAVAQNPSVIQNTRATMNGVRDTSTAASNAALGAQSATTAPAVAHASAAVTPTAKTAAAKNAPAKTATAKTATAKTAHQPKASVHPVKATNTVKLEKAAAPKVEPMASKKVGEIVGNPAPIAADGTASDEDTAAAQKYNANGKRDPFVSPVVAHAANGSNCTSGKKCLEIGAINLRGVVHGENGFIAVVSNSLNKAYFLRENDPVFNGYVVKITGDSIVFQETLQDRLGKTFTREVTKKITVPAV
jgi:hypothetical protein